MKLALVTGGLRRLGAAIAARLAEDGWTLALHCRANGEPDHDLAAILAVHGTQWRGFAADLSDAAAVETLLPAIAAHFGEAPSLIVNNASLFDDDSPATATMEGLTLHQAVNVNAPVILATRLAAMLGEGSTAAIVNITDQRVRHGSADQFGYTLSKQALAAATETLARALAPKVRVNAVAPGLTLPTDDYRPAQMVRLARMMPLERLPEPAEIADAVVWLAGAESVTGQTIFVDGGASLISFARDFVHLGNE
jgi:pteridine reductase